MIITAEHVEKFDNEVTEDRLTFIANQRVVVTVGAYDAEYQICQIVFSKKDGSIIVSMPYLDTAGGVVTAVSLSEQPEPGESLTYSYVDGGKVTRHQVKFTHHPDGRVHFSQDGKVLTRIRRQSFALTSIGQIFHLHAFWPSGFEPFNEFRRDFKKTYVRNIYQRELPLAVRIQGEWRTKRSFRENLQPLDGTAGPKVSVQHRRTGQEFTAFWLAQPRGFPLQSHVLMVSCEAVARVESVAEPTIIFMGGWDAHATDTGSHRPPSAGFLSALYPAHDFEQLEQRLGSIDWRQPELS